MSEVFGIVRSPRLRASPYYEATVKAGATAFMPYNHMLLPSMYTTREDEYEALVNAVAIWDVAAERQVEIQGPDAAALTQYVCTRDVSKLKPGQARYTFICNHDGGTLNDPVLLKLADDHFWLSLADRDILLWVQAVAAERNMVVSVREPDVSPLQVQGPLSANLIEDVFGPEIRNQKYYNFVETELEGVPLVVSRTGWSGEFGYEVFLRDGSKGTWLWNLLFAAGEKYGVKPGAPNQIRRIEGGILSYGNDMDDHVTPLELGLERLVAFDSPDDFIGRAALEAQRSRGVERMLTGIKFGGDPVGYNPELWPVSLGGEQVGHVTSAVYSPRFESNLGFALVGIDYSAENVELDVHLPDRMERAVTAAIPFVEAIKAQ